ncbi:hypothetical protein L1887_51212 [Cichorium endivia]|nr:hypothetical protein L1887_51212 [Cichorium endivia]
MSEAKGGSRHNDVPRRQIRTVGRCCWVPRVGRRRRDCRRSRQRSVAAEQRRVTEDLFDRAAMRSQAATRLGRCWNLTAGMARKAGREQQGSRRLSVERMDVVGREGGKFGFEFGGDASRTTWGLYTSRPSAPLTPLSRWKIIDEALEQRESNSKKPATALSSLVWLTRHLSHG